MQIENLIQMAGNKTDNAKGVKKGSETVTNGDFMTALLGILQQGEKQTELQKLTGNVGQNEDVMLDMAKLKGLLEERTDSKSLAVVDKLLTKLQALFAKSANTGKGAQKKLLDIFSNNPKTLELTKQLKGILQNWQETKSFSLEKRKEFITKINEMLANPQQKTMVEAMKLIEHLKEELEQVNGQQQTVGYKQGLEHNAKTTGSAITTETKDAAATLVEGKAENNNASKQQVKPLSELAQPLRVNGDAKKVTSKVIKPAEPETAIQMKDATANSVEGKAGNSNKQQAKPLSELAQMLKQQIDSDAKATKQVGTETTMQPKGKVEKNVVNKQQAKPFVKVAQLLKQQVDGDEKKATVQTSKLADIEGSTKAKGNASVQSGVKAENSANTTGQKEMKSLPEMVQSQTKSAVQTAEVLKQQKDVGKKQAAGQDVKSIQSETTVQAKASNLITTNNANNQKNADAVQNVSSPNGQAKVAEDVVVNDLKNDSSGEVKHTNSTAKTSTQETQTFSTHSVQREASLAKPESTVKPEQVSGKLLEMVKEMNVKQQPNNTTMRLKLHPEQLGEVTVRLTFNRGELSAHFFASTHHGKEALEAALPQMRDALFQQQVKLSEANVFLGQGNSQWSGQQQQQNRSQGRGWRQGNYYRNSGTITAASPVATGVKSSAVEDGLNLLV